MVLPCNHSTFQHSFKMKDLRNCAQDRNWHLTTTSGRIKSLLSTTLFVNLLTELDLKERNSISVPFSVACYFWSLNNVKFIVAFVVCGHTCCVILAFVCGFTDCVASKNSCNQLDFATLLHAVPGVETLAKWGKNLKLPLRKYHFYLCRDLFFFLLISRNSHGHTVIKRKAL